MIIEIGADERQPHAAGVGDLELAARIRPALPTGLVPVRTACGHRSGQVNIRLR